MGSASSFSTHRGLKWQPLPARSWDPSWIDPDPVMRVWIRRTARHQLPHQSPACDRSPIPFGSALGATWLRYGSSHPSPGFWTRNRSELDRSSPKETDVCRDNIGDNPSVIRASRMILSKIPSGSHTVRDVPYRAYRDVSTSGAKRCVFFL